MDQNNNNPANASAELKIPAGFIPMSSGVQRLQVAARDGYHRHWFRGEPNRIARAQQAGYSFVAKEDVKVNNFDLGGDANASGDTDLGSRVSVISGDDVDNSGQPGRLYLMECPNAYYEYGQRILADRNESVAEALRGGKIGVDRETSEDSSKRYVKGATPDLFNPNRRRT